MTDTELTARLLKDLNCCPVCGSDDLDNLDRDGLYALSMHMKCDSCQATWWEHYAFRSASDLEVER